MKTTFHTMFCLTALTLASVQAQPVPGMAPQAPRPPGMAGGGGGGYVESAPLAKFNLDFTGGTPKQLVTAIEKAMGRPLNAIIPNEYADTVLPALKMNSVDVAQLFSALGAASMKLETSQTPGGGYQMHQTAYGFKTEGRPSDDSIWHFYVEKPVVPPPSPPRQYPKVCQFYSLAPYLEGGLSVDDITTAIETAWKMMGDTSPPTISFHKDTKLLIAVGEERKLEIISDALKALSRPLPVGGGGGVGPRPQPPRSKDAAPTPAPAGR